MHLAYDMLPVVSDDELADFLERFRVITGFPAASLALRSGRRDGYVFSHISGEGLEPLLGTKADPGVGLAGQATFLRRPVVVDDYFGAARITHDLNNVVAELRVCAVVAMPVIAGDDVVGIVYGGRRDDKRITEGQVTRGQRLIDDYHAMLVGHVEPLAPDSVERLLERLNHIHARISDIASTTTDEQTRDRLAALAEATRTPGSADGDGEALSLSKREVDVVAQVAAGRSNVEVGESLGLAPGTVKAYLRTAMRKAGVHNRTALVDRCRRAGLII